MMSGIDGNMVHFDIIDCSMFGSNCYLSIVGSIGCIGCRFMGCSIGIFVIRVVSCTIGCTSMDLMLNYADH